MYHYVELIHIPVISLYWFVHSELRYNHNSQGATDLIFQVSIT